MKGEKIALVYQNNSSIIHHYTGLSSAGLSYKNIKKTQSSPSVVYQDSKTNFQLSLFNIKP